MNELAYEYMKRWCLEHQATKAELSNKSARMSHSGRLGGDDVEDDSLVALDYTYNPHTVRQSKEQQWPLR